MVVRERWDDDAGLKRDVEVEEVKGEEESRGEEEEEKGRNRKIELALLELDEVRFLRRAWIEEEGFNAVRDVGTTEASLPIEGKKKEEEGGGRAMVVEREKESKPKTIELDSTSLFLSLPSRLIGSEEKQTTKRAFHLSS